MGKLYEENWYQKWQKEAISEVVPVPKQSCTGTAQQNAISTGTDQSGTGTDQSGTGTDQSGTGTDQSGTGTDQSSTGTVVPKMLRLCSFCIFKPKFIHR